MPKQSDGFVENLSDFAAGITPVTTFHPWLIEILLTHGPTIRRDQDGELTADFSFESECAMYLDMVTDPDDPNCNEPEARRLAGAFCAIVTQVDDITLRSWLAHLARWAPDTASAIRDYVGGRTEHPVFERIVSRRPWPDHLKGLVKQLRKDRLEILAAGLEINDYASVLSSFAD